jgi:hypothetical protein
VYQGHYDCQGQFWIYCAHRIVICLGVMSSFTSGKLSAGWPPAGCRLAGAPPRTDRQPPPAAPAPPSAAALLATKGAYAQGLVLFFTTVGFLWWFDT